MPIPQWPRLSANCVRKSRWQITDQLAREYGLMSESSNLKSAGFFGNSSSTREQRENALIVLIDKLQPGDWLLVEHPAFDTPEMRAIGHKGYENVGADREAVLYAIVSARVREAVAKRNVKLVSYADLGNRGK